MKAEVIAVGSELLLGQIANTNGQFLSQQLAKAGVDVFYHSVVGDNATRLQETLEIASKRSELIILTGGLGPTKDDLTKEVVASFLHKELVIDEVALEQIVSFFEKRNLPMTENNRKQALVLKEATIFQNHYGMAPGMATIHQGVTYVLLPGPPREMRPMVTEQVIPFLSSHVGDLQIISRVLRFFGIGESKLETELEDLIDGQSNPTIAPLASEGEVTLRLTVKHHDETQAALLLDETERKIRERVGHYFYGYDETSLMEKLVSCLTKTGLSLASAESLTGGLFGARITNIPGASACFLAAITTYTNDMKQSWLNVPPHVLEQHGAVSPECAIAMAQGVKKLTKADVTISFTGVAGPSPSEGKEPGTVFIGLCFRDDEPEAITLQLSGSREQIRERTLKHGCQQILNRIKRWNERSNDKV